MSTYRFFYQDIHSSEKRFILDEMFQPNTSNFEVFQWNQEHFFIKHKPIFSEECTYIPNYLAVCLGVHGTETVPIRKAVCRSYLYRVAKRFPPFRSF